MYKTQEERLDGRRAAIQKYYAADPKRQLERTRKWRKANPEKVREAVRRYRLLHPEKAKANRRKSDLKKKFRLTPSDHCYMNDYQKGKCEICKEQLPTEVDHNHDTGQVRGLLCSNCNTALGLMKDNENTLASAICYLRENREISERIRVI